MAALDEQALIAAGRKVDLSRLPLWSSAKESAFTAEQWVERIDRAKTAGPWDAPTTMSYVFNALRGDALTWFDALPALGYRQDDWDNFKEAFLRTYGTTRTVRTAALNLSDLKQGATEPATRYISRVIKVISDIQAMAPAALPVPAAPWTDAVAAVGGFVALTNAQKTEQAQLLLKAGAQDAYHRIGMQLFIAGLRPALRTELMKSNPQTLRQAFDAVIDAEKIMAEPQKTQQRFGIAAIEGTEEDQENGGQDENDADEEGEIDATIAALSSKLKLLKKKANNKKNKAKNNGQKQQQTQPNKNRSGSNGQSGAKPGACRYCKQEGHFQADCYSRKAAGAPMVDAQGQPFRSGGGVHALNASPQQHFQQQQQQQQFAYNPFAHYAQGDEQSGGVGAIWQSPPPSRWGGGGDSKHFYDQTLNY